MQPDYFSSEKLMLRKASFKESEQSETYGTHYQRYVQEFYAVRLIKSNNILIPPIVPPIVPFTFKST